MRSVLGGVAKSSGVLPSGPLNTALLIGRVQATVAAPCSTGGVRVWQRLLAETSLKHGPEHTEPHFTLLMKEHLKLRAYRPTVKQGPVTQPRA